MSDFRNDAATQNKDTIAKSGDYEMRQGVEKSADKDKQEKTTLTFEKKKEKVQDKDKDMKDVHKQEAAHPSEGKGIIDSIKEKVKDVLGSGDNNKEKDMDKDKHMEHRKDVGISSGSDKYSSNLGTSGGHQQQQHTANLGATTTFEKEKDKDKYSNLGSSGSDQYSAGVGVSASGDKDKFASADKHTNLAGDKYSSNLAGDKYPSAVHAEKPAVTVDRTGLGAEHREVGYDKQANVIPDKTLDKEKDSAHKVDLHASVKTGSTSGSQGSTYKTTESK